MENLNILVENKHVKYATEVFFDNYKEHIAQFINNVLKTEVGSSDAFVEKSTDGQIKIYQTAPDKGYVLAQLPSGVALANYKELPDETKYIVFNGDKLALFVKRSSDLPDIKVGYFTSINDAVKEIDSESVQTAIQTVKSAEKNAAVEAKKAMKKAEKLKKEIRK